MTWERYVALVVALLVAGSLITSTTGFSSADATRNVDVAVVSDEEAYLAIQLECHEGTGQAVIVNRFPAGTTLTVDIETGGTVETIAYLPPGESRSRSFDTVERDRTITIHASGSGVAVRLTRSLPTGC
jgi:hypothetical protein